MARITKEIAGKILGEVPYDKQFYCTDGRIVKNLASKREIYYQPGVNDGTVDDNHR
ncbi:MAG TPA: hypothetical protein G4O17_01875 [Dehalococcoidia bacterium]|nr:hypothetical protein [Dehalococcoidia bacterium]